MPHEDPAAVAARQHDWQNYYRPESPAAQHLVNECIRATLQADRTQKHHDAAIIKQVEEAARRWEDARLRQTRALAAQLASDPGRTVARLLQTGHGCRWMIRRWEALQAQLKTAGRWELEGCCDAVRLLGLDPANGGVNADAFSYLLTLCHLQLDRESQAELIARMLTPACLPQELREVPREHWLPPVERSLEVLLGMVAEEIERLRATERQVAAERDAPERERALDLALTLQDEKAARLYFRYQSESRSTFHRSYKELIGALKRDAESDSRNEPEPASEVADEQALTAELSGCAAPETEEAAAAPEQEATAGESPTVSPAEEAPASSRNEPEVLPEVEEKQEVATDKGCVAGEEPREAQAEPVATNPEAVEGPRPGHPAAPSPAGSSSRNEPEPLPETSERERLTAGPVCDRAGIPGPVPPGWESGGFPASTAGSVLT